MKYMTNLTKPALFLMVAAALIANAAVVFLLLTGMASEALAQRTNMTSNTTKGDNGNTTAASGSGNISGMLQGPGL
jgi:hypothetical protein